MKVAILQDAQGYFNELPQDYSHLESTEVPESVTDTLNDSDDKERVWNTILSICILKKHFKESEGEWTLIVKKAETYLKKAGIKHYKQEIKNAMSLV